LFESLRQGERENLSPQRLKARGVFCVAQKAVIIQFNR